MKQISPIQTSGAKRMMPSRFRPYPCLFVTTKKRRSFSIVALPPMLPDEMHELLRTKRSSTLPANGAVFEFTSDKDIIRKVLLKETLYGDSIYMLYRLDTCEGDLRAI